MSTENEPLRLSPFRVENEANGALTLVKADGLRVELPPKFVPLLKWTQEGSSLSGIAERLRLSEQAPRGGGQAPVTGAPGHRKLFSLVGRYLIFLYDHELLVDRRQQQLAEAIRPDYAWRDSIAFDPLLSFELMRVQTGHTWRAAGRAAIGTLTCLFAAYLMFSATRSALGDWPEFASSVSLLIAFVFAFSVGKSARALVQFLLMNAFTTQGAGLKFRVDPLAISLSNDDASKGRGEGSYVALTFVGLFALLTPIWLSNFVPALGEAKTFIPFFTWLLLIADLSPFRQSAWTEWVRTFYNYKDARDRSRGAEADLNSFMRKIHTASAVAWMAAFAFLIGGSGLKLILHLKNQIDLTSRSSQIATALLVLSQAVLIVSLVDDLITYLSQSGSDARSIRRLWRRRRPSLQVAAAAQAGRSPSKNELGELTMLRQLDAETRSGLLDVAEVVDVQAREVVCRQGESDRTLFFVLSGRLAVARRSSSGRRRVIAFLEAGAVFGELGFFMGERRTADIVATEDSKLLSIRHDERMSTLDPARSEEIKTRTWFLQALMTSAMFKELPSEALDALVFAGKSKRFKAGEKVFSEGETADACYFIIQGQASVSQNFKLINKLQAGDVFGEVALLNPGLLRTATVSADTELLAVRLESDIFWRLLFSHLPLAIEIERVSNNRVQKDKSRQIEARS